MNIEQDQTKSVTLSSRRDVYEAMHLASMIAFSFQFGHGSFLLRIEVIDNFNCGWSLCVNMWMVLIAVVAIYDCGGVSIAPNFAIMISRSLTLNSNLIHSNSFLIKMQIVKRVLKFCARETTSIVIGTRCLPPREMFGDFQRHNNKFKNLSSMLFEYLSITTTNSLNCTHASAILKRLSGAHHRIIKLDSTSIGIYLWTAKKQIGMEAALFDLNSKSAIKDLFCYCDAEESAINNHR